MNMPKGYNDVQPRVGAREQLPPGGYVCRIRGAREETANGYWQIVLAFDVCEGAYSGFFEKRYKEDVQAGRNQWPSVGTHRVFVLDYHNREQCSAEFKGLITAVEESNPGFTMAWGEGSEKELIGKQVGIVFREEEFMLQDGSGVGVATKPMYACGVARIRAGVKAPKKKLLAGAAQPQTPVAQPPQEEACPF